VIRQGKGEPLLLLHGITATERIWRQVIPHLAPHHDTIAITAPGHRGGADWPERPARIRFVVDDAERQLDALGIETAHIAGNSMGGWVSLELARRGRARTVCAFSPAGSFIPGEKEGARRAKHLERVVADARRFRRVLPLIARSSLGRRFGLRLNAMHGDRVAPADMVDWAADSAAVVGHEELLRSPERLEPLDPAPCPITIAWACADRVLRFEPLYERMRALVPGAEYVVLDDVGHVPMMDDPGLVARMILARTGAVAA
jgi:pimeloyl-ACP methyl ester carboxylesterase